MREQEMESVKEQLIRIRNQMGDPKNKHEQKFTTFLGLLINQKNDFIDTADEWSDWVDQNMQSAFESEILEETGEFTLQEVFSDAYYSAMQDVRDAMRDAIEQ